MNQARLLLLVLSVLLVAATVNATETIPLNLSVNGSTIMLKDDLNTKSFLNTNQSLTFAWTVNTTEVIFPTGNVTSFEVIRNLSKLIDTQCSNVTADEIKLSLEPIFTQELNRVRNDIEARLIPFTEDSRKLGECREDLFNKSISLSDVAVNKTLYVAEIRALAAERDALQGSYDISLGINVVQFILLMVMFFLGTGGYSVLRERFKG